MIEKLLFLIFAHFIGDWGLQSEWMAENKRRSRLVLFAHCMIWTGCIVIMMDLVHIYGLCWKALFLSGWHMLIDGWKCQRDLRDKNELGWALYLDQVLHIAQVIIVGVL